MYQGTLTHYLRRLFDSGISCVTGTVPLAQRGGMIFFENNPIAAIRAFRIKLVVYLILDDDGVPAIGACQWLRLVFLILSCAA